MTELRAHVDTLPLLSEAEQRLEHQREAHMRLAIAAALKETDGAVAVVTGAWHVPALRRKVAAGDDRDAAQGAAQDQGRRPPGCRGPTRGSHHPAAMAPACRRQAGTRTSGRSSSATTRRARSRTAHLHGALAGARRSACCVRTAARPRRPPSSRRRDSPRRWQPCVIWRFPGSTRCARRASPRFAKARSHRGASSRPSSSSAVRSVRSTRACRRCRCRPTWRGWQKKLKLKPEALDSDVSLDLQIGCRPGEVAAAPPPRPHQRAVGPLARRGLEPGHLPRELAAALAARILGQPRRSSGARHDRRAGRRQRRDRRRAKGESRSARSRRR